MSWVFRGLVGLVPMGSPRTHGVLLDSWGRSMGLSARWVSMGCLWLHGVSYNTSYWRATCLPLILSRW